MVCIGLDRESSKINKKLLLERLSSVDIEVKWPEKKKEERCSSFFQFLDCLQL
jgi:hypothetical protein